MTVVMDLANIYQRAGGLPCKAAAYIHERDELTIVHRSQMHLKDSSPEDVQEQSANILRPQNTMDTVQMAKITGNF
jgi:hypothetical protein